MPSSLATQSFFAWRIHIISGRWIVSLVSWTGCIGRVAITLAICILSAQEAQLPSYQAKYPWTIVTSLGLAMVIDILNTSSLCYYLHKLRSGVKGQVLTGRYLTPPCIKIDLQHGLCNRPYHDMDNWYVEF
jgi:hypothetical protein